MRSIQGSGGTFRQPLANINEPARAGWVTNALSFAVRIVRAWVTARLAEALGEACLGWGAMSISGGKYAAMGWAMVADQDAFNTAMATHGAKIMGDVANYTNVQPELLIGDVVAPA